MKPDRPALLLPARTLFFASLAALVLHAPALGNEERQKQTPEVPSVLMDENHARSELGVNEFTAPSIRRIFSNLENLPSIPQDKILRVRTEKLPMDRGDLALELGFLIADGFIIVQNGKLNEVRPLAQELSRYAKALGAGDKVNRHAAILLQHAEEGNTDKLKDELALTQRDVESELISLRDPDLAHFIGLGGWIRALDVATAALKANFSPDRARILFQPDIPEYFEEALSGLDPLMTRRKDIAEMRKSLRKLHRQMTLPEFGSPGESELDALETTTRALTKQALTRVGNK